MLRFLANHVIEIMYFAARHVIAMVVIVLISIQRVTRIIVNLDFPRTAILAIGLRILIGIARI